MKHEVIMHNSISLDGRITGFEANMGFHYGIVGGYAADIYMVGSNTARTGIEIFGGVPPESPSDYEKPEKAANLSYWVIPDTKGTLKGMLHTFRRYDLCRDVIMLISRTTGRDYVDYLEERHYDYLVSGEDYVDYHTAFEILAAKYHAKRILVDTGPTLSGILLQQGLIDEISLLVHPCLAGNKALGVFEKLGMKVELVLIKHETLEDNFLRVVWRVDKR